MTRKLSTPVVGIAVLVCIACAGRSARAELPQTFDVPAVTDDYLINYGLAFGIWTSDQYSLHHRLGLQIPLWAAAAGAQLSFTNVFGELSDSGLGNLRLYLQWFHNFEWARRANFWIGGGLDGYVPTATAFEAESETALLVGSPAAGDSSLVAPDTTFGLRPRLQLAGQAWIFSVQMFGAAAVQFVGNEVRVAFEWGINFSANATEWLAIVAEATGVSWTIEPPPWMAPRSVTIGGGLRFNLPGGWLPGIWFRVPATGGDTGRYGDVAFIGLELTWRHGRNWFLF